MRNFTFLREKERQYSLIEINRIGYYTIEEMIHLLKDEFIGVNIKEKMDIVGQDSVTIKDNDIVIKLTGRYLLTSPLFLNEIIEKETKYDAFIKFYGSCSLKYEIYDCIFFCFLKHM